MTTPAEVFKENGYLVLSGFLSADTCDVIIESSLLTGLTSSKCDAQNIPSQTLYGSPHGDALLSITGQRLSRTFGEVLPTVSFFRIYNKDAVLGMHKDRESCEVSMTVALSDNDWPFDVVDKQGNKKSYVLNRGDAVLYRGCEVEHGRTSPLKEDQSAHIFLHYVEATGKYKHKKFDGRDRLGIMGKVS